MPDDWSNGPQFLSIIARVLPTIDKVTYMLSKRLKIKFICIVYQRKCNKHISLPEPLVNAVKHHCTLYFDTKISNREKLVFKTLKSDNTICYNDLMQKIS